MKHSIVVKKTPLPNKFTVLYTTPIDVLYATVSINILNLVNEDAGVYIAITKTIVPLEFDYIDYKLPIKSLGGQICREGFILSAGEQVVVMSDQPLTIFRLTGIVETVDTASLLEYNYYPNDPSKRINIFYMYSADEGVDFNIKAKGLVSINPIIQVSKTPDFTTLENININALNYNSMDGTSDIRPFFTEVGDYYIRISNDNQSWSNIVNIDIQPPPTTKPSISALPNCDLPANGVMLNTGPATDVNAGFILTTYNFFYIAIDAYAPLTQVLISTSPTFDPDNTTITSDYDINDSSKYYLKLDPTKTYYVKAFDISNGEAIESDVFTLNTCR